eukprot:2365031-Rhodomonas_salina.1
MLEPRGMIKGAAPRFKHSTLIPPVAFFICIRNELVVSSSGQWNATVLLLGLRIEEFWFEGKCWSQE